MAETKPLAIALQPLLSSVINSRGDNFVSFHFGNTWQECLLPVKYFRITVGYDHKMERIRNIAVGNASDCCTGTDDYVFSPMDGEVVTQVDVRHTDEWITAVRFHTDKQLSQWFGSTEGKTTSLQAPAGYYIHSLVGSCTKLKGSSNSLRVGLLAVLFRPRHEEPSRLPLDPRNYVYSPFDHKDKVVDACFDMSAVMVKMNRCNARVEAISILSASQFQDYSLLADVIAHPRDEHCVILAAGERIIEVHAVSVNEWVKKLRFVTNFRTTPWIGVEGEGELQVFDLTGKPEGSYICGFQTTRRCGSIGVVYWVPNQEKEGETDSVGQQEVEWLSV